MLIRSMIRALPVALLLLLAMPGSASAASWFERLKDALGGSSESAQPLTSTDIGLGLKEALRVGTERVVADLGRTDGFNLDPQIHIALPPELERVKDVLATVGLESALADLELRMNRAAEIATPRARQLFIDAIAAMTLEDVNGILHGAPDAATQYFKASMSGPLATEMVPVVEASLAESGVVQAYDTVMARYNAVPFVPKVDADLGRYVVDRGVHGVFFYLAKEEAAIRQDPAKRTTELLKRVFDKS